MLGCAGEASRPLSHATATRRGFVPTILSATQRPGVSRASWGIVVNSLDRHDRLVDLNARTLFVPASVAKLVSVATAAEAVGWDYRFETSLLTTGSVSQGRLFGDLIVVGSGDPSIGGRGGGDLSAFVAAVKAAGFERIEGRIVGDDDALEEPRPQLSWAWDDLGYTTGSLFGALNLAENRTVVTVTSGVNRRRSSERQHRGTRRRASDRQSRRNRASRVAVARMARTASGRDLADDRGIDSAGCVSRHRLASRVEIRRSGSRTVLRNRLIEEGIVVTGEAVDIDDLSPPPDRSDATMLFTYRSPTLAEIARPLLKESINLYGEAFMRLNTDKGVFPTNDAALDGLRKRLTAWGLSDGSYQLVDGSGLSRRDAISPEAVMAVLQRMSDSSGRRRFLTALPIAGVDGSLATRMKGTAAEGNLRAKTGTMSNIRSLAGYVTARNGEHLAFAILINNFEGTSAAANQAIDAVAVRLAEFTR